MYRYMKREIRPLLVSAGFFFVLGMAMSLASWGATYLPNPYDILPKALVGENFVPATLTLVTVTSAFFAGIAFLSAYRPGRIGGLRRLLFWISEKIADFFFTIVSLCYGILIANFLQQSVWGVESNGISASQEGLRLFPVLALYAAYFLKAPSAAVGWRKFSLIMGLFCISFAALAYYVGSQIAADQRGVEEYLILLGGNGY